MKTLALALALALAAPRASELHVSPAGKPDNAGTKESPWDLATALSNSKKVEPGSTVRFTLMPASRNWPAIASPVFFCHSSSTVINSCSKSACPASANTCILARWLGYSAIAGISTNRVSKGGIAASKIIAHVTSGTSLRA